MNMLIDLTGERFGKLIVREKLPPTRDGRTRWLCDCACKTCIGKATANMMAESAGFIEGTQLSKLTSKKINANNSSGVRGVLFNRKTGRWRASIIFQKKNYYLGKFVKLEDAVAARHRGEELYYAPMLEKYDT